MGIELFVYFEIDQNIINQFIKHHNINDIDLKDNTNWQYRKIIANYYKSEFLLDLRDVDVYYHWDNQLGLHELYSCKPVKFIREDPTFYDQFYHDQFEAFHGVPFPECLNHFLYNISDKTDASEVADELIKYYSEDDALLSFANWLKCTSSYAVNYELSY